MDEVKAGRIGKHHNDAEIELLCHMEELALMLLLSINYVAKDRCRLPLALLIHVCWQFS